MDNFIVRDIQEDGDVGELAEDEKKVEGFRILFLIIGPNGLRWRILSRLDDRAYAVWRLTEFYGGAKATWPALALSKIKKEPRAVRLFLHDLAKQFAMICFSNIDRGATWDMEGMV